MPETWFHSLGQEDPLKEEMATHSSILAWKILWTEEPGGLQSMGVTNNSNDNLPCMFKETSPLVCALEWKCVWGGYKCGAPQ